MRRRVLPERAEFCEHLFIEHFPEGRLVLRVFSRRLLHQFRIPFHFFHPAIGIDEILEVGADHPAQPCSHRIFCIQGGVLGGVSTEQFALPIADLHRQALKFELQLLAAIVEVPDQGETEVLGHFLHLLRLRFRFGLDCFPVHGVFLAGLPFHLHIDGAALGTAGRCDFLDDNCRCAGGQNDARGCDDCCFCFCPGHKFQCSFYQGQG